MNHDLPWLQEELAAQSDWVRRLARSLVHDESAAEDLVQDTWLTALRSPPTERGALRGWLGRVVRTLAWKRQRKAAPTSLSGAEGDLPGGAPESELVERLELHRLLAEELHSLREPLRTTLLQRYFDGLSAADIAEQSDKPALTVRWQLQQGLEELRARLDERFGGKRNEWMSALAFAIPSKGAVLGGSGVAIGEGVLMSTLMQCAISAVVLAAAVMLALPFVTKDASPDHAPVSTLAATPTFETEHETKPALAADAGTGRRESIESLGNSGSTASPALDPTHVRILARVLDESRNPLPNGRLEMNVKGSEGPDFLHADADAQGVVQLEYSEPDKQFSIDVLVSARGYVSRRVPADCVRGQVLYLGDILLQLGGGVSGRVIGRDGTPRAGLLVIVRPAGEAVIDGKAADGTDVVQPERRDSMSKAIALTDGSFSIEGVPPGSVRVWAKFDYNNWAQAGPLDVRAGQHVSGVELVAPASLEAPKLVIRGVVLRPDGSPFPDADVGASGSSSEYRGRTGSDGSFALAVTSTGPYVVYAFSSHNGTTPIYEPLELRDVKPNSEPLTLRFDEAGWLRLQLFDGEEPINSFEFSGGLIRVRSATGARQVWPQHPPGAEHNVLQILTPRDEFYMQVSQAGRGMTELGPFRRNALPQLVRVDLAPAIQAHGRVLAQGNAVAGATIELHEELLLGEARVGEFLTLVEPELASRRTSHADGSFAIGVSEPGTYRLFVETPGFARADGGSLELSTNGSVPDVVIALNDGGTLEGHVLVPAGQSPAGVIVGMNRGDGAPLTQRVGPDGAYRFERLTPGRYELVHARQQVHSRNGSSSKGRKSELALALNCTIEAGKTCRQDLDLREERPCVLRGTILLDGQPAFAWSVGLSRADWIVNGGFLEPVSLNSAGRYSLTADGPGMWTATLRSSTTTQPSIGLTATLPLKAGENDWSFDIRTTRVTGRASTAHMGALGCRTHPPGLVEAVVMIKLAEDGTFDLPMVPIGPGEIAEYGASADDIKVLTSFQVMAGATTHVEIP